MFFQSNSNGYHFSPYSFTTATHLLFQVYRTYSCCEGQTAMSYEPFLRIALCLDKDRVSNVAGPGRITPSYEYRCGMILEHSMKMLTWTP